MPFTRRQVLTLTGASLPLSLLTWWPRRETPPVPASRPDELSAWIDTLMPVEADFPGAVALGVSKRMAATIAREPAYARLTAAAVAWLAARSREAWGRPLPRYRKRGGWTSMRPLPPARNARHPALSSRQPSTMPCSMLMPTPVPGPD
ncbi:MAG: hypothetical protein J5X22_23335 [Candidatus Accumulibacter sp.]|uniref:hypothetical protein n=1 Tax=Accumulibacter sp. TaxID=2053492 RepID=UPI001AD17674|nr:hypothetical protein [Accumulibacter sp.]MBN8516513.1 hypothetical protein [Accumulibacter sp.]MBO3713298.1 hypothetical protein [Accumulibacter sp.]